VSSNLTLSAKISLVKSPFRAPRRGTLSGTGSNTITAHLPGSIDPNAALITAQEIWQPTGSGRFERSEYGYDLIDYPANRRRAFHIPNGRCRRRFCTQIR
jgi:hypothetical protein